MCRWHARLDEGCQAEVRFIARRTDDRVDVVEYRAVAELNRFRLRESLDPVQARYHPALQQRYHVLPAPWQFQGQARERLETPRRVQFAKGPPTEMSDDRISQ